MRLGFVIVVCSLLLIIPIQVLSQDEGSFTCEDYLGDLESELLSLNIRLNTFAKTPNALRSDYLAWQEKRVAWQEITPPDCILSMHDDVIAMYANLGDISLWGLWLEVDPSSNSGMRLVQEAIERAKSSIQSIAESLSELTGNELIIDEVSDSLDAIATRFSEG